MLLFLNKKCKFNRHDIVNIFDIKQTIVILFKIIF